MIDIPYLSDFTPFSALLRILLAALLGAAVGFERGRHGRAAGLRTHVLVCVGSALSSMTGLFFIESYGMGDPSRIAAGVVSGIGFLGAGMIIIKRDTKVTGLTTAAALWATATVGLAAGAGFYIGALFGTVVIFLTTAFLTIFEVRQKKDRCFYLEIGDVSAVNGTLDALKDCLPQSHDVELTAAKSGLAGHIGLHFTVNTATVSAAEVLTAARTLPAVIFAAEE